MLTYLANYFHTGILLDYGVVFCSCSEALTFTKCANLLMFLYVDVALVLTLSVVLRGHVLQSMLIISSSKLQGGLFILFRIQIMSTQTSLRNKLEDLEVYP